MAVSGELESSVDADMSEKLPLGITGKCDLDLEAVREYGVFLCFVAL